ncbi:alpha/beta fold hydrolase [Streptosporangium sp. NPDC000396]|uniref:alpha/beta fold hydrolase n=1 Tax=Streptosporangium sp. NPDC000396 TaxID=3366185 RepID=UPI0036BCF4F7
MPKVTSKDGTQIAFDKRGRGPAVILVDGAFANRSFGPNGELAEAMAEHFTVFNYDRRGRNESGDTAPWAIEREIEDIEALVEEAGGSAHLYAISSGVPLALAAANRSLVINKLALYEPPFIVDDSRTPMSPDYAAEVDALLSAGRRGDTVKLFMTKAVKVPSIAVFIMQFTPAWSKLKSVAHTLRYDTALMEGTWAGQPLPAERWSSVTIPTLVMSGGKSPAWMQKSAKTLAEVLPNARHRTLDGQTHLIKAKVLAPELVDFFAG